MDTHPVILAILEKQGDVVAFTAEDEESPATRSTTIDALAKRWDVAFSCQGDRVVIALGGSVRKSVLAVEDIEGLHEALAQLPGGDVEMLLSVPRECWREVRMTPNIGSVIEQTKTGWVGPDAGNNSTEATWRTDPYEHIGDLIPQN